MSEEPITHQPAVEQELPAQGFLVALDYHQECVDASGTYVAYHIDARFGANNTLGMAPGTFSVFRRYNDFAHLVAYLRVAQPFVVVPPIPEKKTNFKLKQLAIDISDEVFVGKRRFALAHFVRRCLDHEVIRQDPGFQAFLVDEDWRTRLMVKSADGTDEIFTGPEWLSSFRTLTVSRSSEQPPLEFKHFKAFAGVFEEHLSTILHAHAQSAYKTQELLPVFEGFEEAFGVLSSLLEPLVSPMKSLAGPLEAVSKRAAGMAKITVRRLRHEERDFADTLFGCVGYSESIQAQVRNEELIYATKARAAENHQAKLKTITALERPEEDKSLSGFFTRLTTSEASKAGKIDALKAEAAQLQKVADDAAAKYADFVAHGLEEIKRFNGVRKHELLTFFRQLAMLQREYARIMVKRWTDVQNLVARGE
eukprot:m.12940 g.12940  ORF g.12940 m.12940 type:complete len:423 (-) comp7099_c0_seq1:116-1384(-)